MADLADDEPGRLRANAEPSKRDRRIDIDLATLGDGGGRELFGEDAGRPIMGDRGDRPPAAACVGEELALVSISVVTILRVEPLRPEMDDGSR